MENKDNIFSEWVLPKVSDNNDIYDNHFYRMHMRMDEVSRSQYVKMMVIDEYMMGQIRKIIGNKSAHIGTVLLCVLYSIYFLSNQEENVIYGRKIGRLDGTGKKIDIRLVVKGEKVFISEILDLHNKIMDLYEESEEKHNLCAMIQLDNIHYSDYTETNNKINVTLQSCQRGTELGISYITNCVSSLFVSKLFEEVKRLLRFIFLEGNLTISSYIMMRNQIIYKHYDRLNQQGKERSIENQRLFELLGQHRDDKKIAVKCNGIELTYEQLFIKAAVLATDLSDRGVKKGSVVGIMLDRGVDWFVAVLGIVQLGGVCMPIDIKLPTERINQMINDSSAECVITSICIHKHIEINVTTCYMDEIDFEGNSPYLCYEMCTPMDPVYLIYTSGSTGKPKGIILNHQGIINHIFTKISVLQLTEEDKFAHNFSFGFVASIWLVFAPLVLGATVNIYEDRIINNPIKLFSEAKHDNITILEVIPWSLGLFLKKRGDEKSGKNKDSSKQIGNIRSIILTGEKVNPSLVNQFYSCYNIKLYNAYGQTECSDDTLHYLFECHKKHERSIIGIPSLNTHIYIFGPNFELREPEQPGILYISGKNQANGYLNQQESTYHTWIMNPMKPEERIYKTNDLVRLTGEGTIEYIGRTDNQIKIRGHRIEMNDIAWNIMMHAEIHEAVVVDFTDREGNSELTCFYISDIKIDLNQLKKFLFDKLPYYMIPKNYIRLQEIPRTENGKVNRIRLQEYAMRQKIELSSRNNFISEYDIVNIYEKVLNTKNILPEDDFFILGGDSMQVISLFHILSSNYVQKIDIIDLFEYTSARSLAKYLNELNLLDSHKTVKKDVPYA